MTRTHTLAAAALLSAAALVAAAPLAAAEDAYEARTRTGALDPVLDDRLFELSKKGLGQYYDNDFETAIVTFRQLIALDPTSPNGHVFLVGTYQAMMQDYRTRGFKKPFETHMDKALELAEDRIDAGVSKARAYQYLGAAYGFKGLYSAMEKSWWTAFRDGQKAYDALRDALKLRPDIADADYGVGFFLYWRAVKASVLKFLLFWGDTKPDGIRRLERAAKDGELCAPLAQMALIKVAANEKDWAQVHARGAEFQKKYPGNVGIWWERGRAYLAQKDWPKVRETYAEIERRLKLKKYASQEAVTETRYWRAVADLNEGKRAEAEAALRAIVDAEDDLDEDLWQDQDYVDAAQDRLDELKK